MGQDLVQLMTLSDNKDRFYDTHDDALDLTHPHDNNPPYKVTVETPTRETGHETVEAFHYSPGAATPPVFRKELFSLQES